MAKVRKTAKAKKSRKATKSRKAKTSYADALQALKAAKATHKVIGQGKINMTDLRKFLDKNGIPFHRVRFVALNAPFMRRSPTSAV